MWLMVLAAMAKAPDWAECIPAPEAWRLADFGLEGVAVVDTNVDTENSVYEGDVPTVLVVKGTEWAVGGETVDTLPSGDLAVAVEGTLTDDDAAKLFDALASRDGDTWAVQTYAYELNETQYAELLNAAPILATAKKKGVCNEKKVSKAKKMLLKIPKGTMGDTGQMKTERKALWVRAGNAGKQKVRLAPVAPLPAIGTAPPLASDDEESDAWPFRPSLDGDTSDFGIEMRSPALMWSAAVPALCKAEVWVTAEGKAIHAEATDCPEAHARTAESMLMTATWAEHKEAARVRAVVDFP